MKTLHYLDAYVSCLLFCRWVKFSLSFLPYLTGILTELLVSPRILTNVTCQYLVSGQDIQNLRRLRQRGLPHSDFDAVDVDGFVLIVSSFQVTFSHCVLHLMTLSSPGVVSNIPDPMLG